MRLIIEKIKRIKFNNNQRVYKVLNLKSDLSVGGLLVNKPVQTNIHRGGLIVTQSDQSNIHRGTEKLIEDKTYLQVLPLFSTIWAQQNSGDPTIFEHFVNNFWKFVHIWPASQWFFSLVSLVLMYWLIGSWYNKRLQKDGGWLSWKARVGMISIDLALNLGLGIYYMDMRDTFMGEIMFRCPIAISPLIFFIEFVVFAWYYRKYVLKKKQ